jgi:hypothetical protein
MPMKKVDAAHYAALKRPAVFAGGGVHWSSWWVGCFVVEVVGLLVGPKPMIFL